MLKFEDLKPAPYNPRAIGHHEKTGLKASIETFGDISGITWNKRTGNIVAGHQRVDQLVELGAEIDDGEIVLPDGNRFSVRVVDWPIDKEKAANISANNPNIAGGFDDNLNDLIKSLDFDISSLNIKELLVPSKKTGQDLIIHPEEQTTKIGDLWTLGDHTLFCGDSSEYGFGIFNTLIFDPPWEIEPKHDYDVANKLVFTDGCRASQAIDWFGSPSWVFVWDCVTSWYVPNRPLRRMKLALWYGDITKYDFNGAHYGDPGKVKMVTNTRGSYNYIPDERGKHLSDVFQMQITKLHSEEKHKHSKPTDWIRMLIGNCTRGDIYDPFIGYGSSIIAAEQLGRKCAGVEIDPLICDAAIKRWEDFTGKRAMLASL